MIIKEIKVKRKNSDKIDIKVEYKCDECHEPRQTHKTNLKNKQKHICKKCRNKINGVLKRGKKSSKKGRQYKNLQRENSANWNGGKYINKAGYVMVLVKSGSINRKSGWENYRPEHIVIMEDFIGRKLRNNECVHHIDGNRQNNNIDNLVLIDSNQHHRKTHNSLQKVGYQLLKEGKIKFNRQTKEYEIVLTE